MKTINYKFKYALEMFLTLIFILVVINLFILVQVGDTEIPQIVRVMFLLTYATIIPACLIGVFTYRFIVATNNKRLDKKYTVDNIYESLKMMEFKVYESRFEKK